MDSVSIYRNDKIAANPVENSNAHNQLNYDELIGIIWRCVFVILIAQFHEPLIALCVRMHRIF